MNSPAVLPVCFVIGYILMTADALKCQSPQYVIIGEKGEVECEFPKQFTGVVWYDSTNISKAVVTRLEKQEDGALIVSGNGYDSGYYDMYPNGSLFIPSVSVYHDRIFKVVVIDEAFKVENEDILIITIVHPSQSTPFTESCGAEGLCLFNPKEIEHLRCIYNHGRPPVMLSWSKNDGERAKTLDAQFTTTSDGQYTFYFHNAVGWTILVVIAIVALVGGVPCVTYYVHPILWIYFIPTTLDGLLTCSTKTAQSILSWPLYEKNNCVVFNEDGIQLLRTVSKDIEENRHKKNSRVIGGALAAIAGAVITFAGVVLPIAGSVLICGIVVGAAGTVVNIGSSVWQMVDDNDKRAKVKPSLKNFINFQKNLAVTTNNLAIVFHLMQILKIFRECKQRSIPQTVMSQMKAIFKKMQKEHYGLMLHDKLKLASEGTAEIVEILKEEVIYSPFNEAISKQGSNLSEEIINARELPFACLPTSTKTLVKTTNPKKGKPTILTLVILLYVDTSDRNVNVRNVEPGGASVGAAAAGRGVDGAINLTSRGILVGNRLILKSLDLSDDAIRLTNFMKIAKAVSVAGIILSAIGVVVDVAFLGHAVYDEMREEKSESAQSMLDIANVMEEINQLSSRKLKLAS